MSWQKELRLMKLEYVKRTAYDFFMMSGGYSMKTKPYEDHTANGLTKSIIDWITFTGGTANRISTQGQSRIINGKAQWTKGTTRKGTADIHAIVKGRHISIEVKIGKDQMSEAQIREQQKITSAGGLYFIAKDMVSFLEWYNYTVNQKNTVWTANESHST